ncbi:MAG: LacI family transcriptional regulator [Candidatus Omnitrophica bacterium]|nr:LacI family transcriptional regulator [Candidatus Omnitrophota bacterium]MCM8802100.1 LacI family transcriptional regulator [Candidatus Omnitrophota bacterium]
MKKRPSLKDIAKLAGTSKVVVYTVLKGRENKGIFVSKKTKEKILKIANQLGYVPPKSAKELFTGRSDTIGIIFHRLTPYFSSLVELIQIEALKNGFEITPYITNGNWKLEKHYLELCRDGRVDGIVTIAHTDKSIELYKEYTKPPFNLKLISYGPPIEGISTIQFDEEKAGRLAASHLIEIGCKSFAFFGGERNSGRCNGFINYLKEKGFEPVIFVKDKFVGYYDDGLKLAQEFFSQKEIPEGVFSNNDILGAVLIKEAKKRNIKVPERLAVIGCDNTEVCLYTEPELTSIDTNIKKTAKKTIELMKKLISGEKIPQITKIDVKLIKRKSTERR